MSRRPILAVLVALATLAGCAGSSATPPVVPDPAASATVETLPEWFPARFVPPPGSVVIDVIESPEPDQGRTVTWRSDLTFSEAATKIEATLSSLGWKPTRKLIDGGKDAPKGSRRTSWFIENGSVFVIRLFEDDNLKGLRLSVELQIGRASCRERV